MSKKRTKSGSDHQAKRPKVEDEDTTIPAEAPEVLNEATLARRREDRDLYERLLAEIAKMRDATGREIVGMFLEVPSRKLYPDYPRLIKHPISLKEIRAKCTELQYAAPSDFVADLELMAQNASTFNDPDSEIARDAERIAYYARTEARAFELRRAQLDIVDALVNHTDNDGRLLSDIFMVEPSREDYPDYYKVITRAMSFETLRNQLAQPMSLEQFVELTQLIFSNAKTYNQEESQVYQDAVVLEQLFERKREELLSKFKPASSSIKLKLGRRKDEDNGDQEDDGDEDEAEEEDDDDDDFDYGRRRSKSAAVDDDLDLELGLTRARRARPRREFAELPPTNESKILRAHPLASPQDALLQCVTVTTLVPSVPKGGIAKTAVVAPSMTDQLEVVIPASPRRGFQSYAVTLPSWHPTINVNTDLHPSLHSRHHQLTVKHNTHRMTSSSSVNNWADTSKAIRAKFQIHLQAGVNQIEVAVHAADGPASDDDSGVDPPLTHTEQLVLWVHVGR